MLEPGEQNGNPLQYSCLGNSMDRGAYQATDSPWGHKESDTTDYAYAPTHECLITLWQEEKVSMQLHLTSENI